MYTEVSNIFYGSDREQFNEIQKENISFGISPYLEPLSEESFDHVFITEINGQEHCFIKKGDYEFHVTKNTEVEMCVTPNKKTFIQRNFDPKTKTSTRYSLNQFDDTVELSFDMDYSLEDGKTEGCSFLVQLPATENFWNKLRCGARSIDSIVDYFIQHTTSEPSKDLLSTFGVKVGHNSVEISSENYGSLTSYSESTNMSIHDKRISKSPISSVQHFKGTIAEQFLQVLRMKSPNFKNDKNSHIFELFRKLDPTLRHYVDDELSVRYGDNLDALLQNNKIEKDTALKND